MKQIARNVTAEVLTLRDLVTYYVLFFTHLEGRRVCIAGITVRQR
jgi:putative transposase